MKHFIWKFIWTNSDSKSNYARQENINSFISTHFSVNMSYYFGKIFHVSVSYRFVNILNQICLFFSSNHFDCWNCWCVTRAKFWIYVWFGDGWRHILRIIVSIALMTYQAIRCHVCVRYVCVCVSKAVVKHANHFIHTFSNRIISFRSILHLIHWIGVFIHFRSALTWNFIVSNHLVLCIRTNYCWKPEKKLTIIMERTQKMPKVAKVKERKHIENIFVSF